MKQPTEMANAVPIFLEILLCFLLSTSLLNRYSDMVNNNIVTVVGVFISWFFSFMVVFMLPTDLTSTAYRQCLLDYQASINSSTTPAPSLINSTVLLIPQTNNYVEELSEKIIPQPSSFANSATSPIQNVSDQILQHSRTNILLPNDTNPCQIPWNYVSDNALMKLWRFIYWTSQFLTWLLLPIMQSYSMAGDFTTVDKLKSALRANLIYYSAIGAIFTTLLIYVILRSGLDFASLKVTVISSSNTWGLFLLVALLGYGLVELPRFCMNQSRCFQSLSRHYFRVGKLNAEKCVAEEQLDDVLEEIQQVHASLGSNEHNPLQGYLVKIISRCPPDWERRSNRISRQVAASNSMYEIDGSKMQGYDLQALVRLHKRVIKAVHYHRQIICRWNHLITEVIEWEDVARNHMDSQSTPRVFKSTLPKERSLFHPIFTPRIEWYWKCLIRVWLFRVIGLITAALSVAVVWSEITFPIAIFAPRLSIFAFLVDSFASTQQYFYLELFSLISIGYLAICAFYTVFHMRIYNVYYLAPNKQTDEYSLSFSGMLVCRLATPLCLNYLCLVNKDSHFIKRDSRNLETSFTSIMGHLDLIPVINSGLNIFLPLCISAICLAIYFDFGKRVLHYLGYEQFIEDDEMTSDLVQTGRQLVEREKGKLLRNYESATGAYHEMISAQQSIASSSTATKSYTSPPTTTSVNMSASRPES